MDPLYLLFKGRVEGGVILARAVTQRLKRLPGKCKVLSSVPSMENSKKKERGVLATAALTWSSIGFPPQEIFND